MRLNLPGVPDITEKTVGEKLRELWRFLLEWRRELERRESVPPPKPAESHPLMWMWWG